MPPGDRSLATWKTLLDRGDGQGMVPLEIAQGLWAKGWTQYEPQRPRHGSIGSVMVKLKEEVRSGRRD